jgi:hypothetical protein
MDLKLNFSKIEINGKETWKVTAYHQGKEFVGYGTSHDDALHDLMEQNIGEIIFPV